MDWKSLDWRWAEGAFFVTANAVAMLVGLSIGWSLRGRYEPRRERQADKREQQ